MKTTRIAAALLGSLLLPAYALAGPADRVDSRVDSTRAKTQDRLNTVKEGQTTQETITTEQIITVPPKKGAHGELTAKPQIKRIPRTETIQKPLPTRVNPF